MILNSKRLSSNRMKRTEQRAALQEINYPQKALQEKRYLVYYQAKRDDLQKYSVFKKSDSYKDSQKSDNCTVSNTEKNQ